jgi:flagellar motor switch protein FliN/FliY
MEDALDRTHSLEDLTIEAMVRIGTTTLPLRSILNIKVGEVVALDRPLVGMVEVIAGGRAVAKGELVLVDGCFAVSVTEVAGMEMHLPEEG